MTNLAIPLGVFCTSLSHCTATTLTIRSIVLTLAFALFLEIAVPPSVELATYLVWVSRAPTGFVGALIRTTAIATLIAIAVG